MEEERKTVRGSDLVDVVKQMLHEGNVRRVRVIHKGKTLLDVPMAVGLPAAAAMMLATPLLAVVGVVAAMVTECTLEVQRAGD